MRPGRRLGAGFRNRGRCVRRRCGDWRGRFRFPLGAMANACGDGLHGCGPAPDEPLRRGLDGMCCSEGLDPVRNFGDGRRRFVPRLGWPTGQAGLELVAQGRSACAR